MFSYSQYSSLRTVIIQEEKHLAIAQMCRLVTWILLNVMGLFLRTNKGYNVQIEIYLIPFKSGVCYFIIQLKSILLNCFMKYLWQFSSYFCLWNASYFLALINKKQNDTLVVTPICFYQYALFPFTKYMGNLDYNASQN